jgi:hypothetical protein
MKGDFTRDTFRPEKHYQQVLMQQGRVQLDADWNEQAAIVAQRDATMMADLVGRCGGPAGNAAFQILTQLSEKQQAPPGDFYLSAGRYYVDGVLCELEAPEPPEAPVLFSAQPHRRYSPDAARTLEADGGTPAHYLVYLDVWQRHVTVHDDPDLREPALGGPDTGTRVQTIWQVRALRIGEWNPQEPCAAPEFDALVRPAFPTLSARTVTPDAESAPCTVPSSAGYRGLENQLYRVEIHKPGGLGTATFKWARDNGSVVARILSNVAADPSQLNLESLGRDGAATFAPGDLVEIVHDANELEGTPGQLARVVTTTAETGSVTVEPLDSALLPVNRDDGPRLRKWDRFLTIPSTSGDGAFVALESGIEVRFDAASPAQFRTGDYWLIPARAASPEVEAGRIEWPGSPEDPGPLPPKGIKHHYARLGVVMANSNNTVTSVADCRCLWPPLSSVPHLFYVSGDGQAVQPTSEHAVTHHVNGRPFYKLPQPLVVGVPGAHCLREEARVHIEVVKTGAGRSDGLVTTTGPSGVASGITVNLDAHGLARFDFYLDGVHGTQQVTAVLLNAADRPLLPPVVFTARLLASDPSSADPAPVRIVGVDLAVRKPGEFGLDTVVALEELMPGIVIHCDRFLDERTLADDITRGQPTCYVTIELPTTADVLHGAGTGFIGPEVAGYTPLVLAAKVEVGSTSDPDRLGQIRWTPAPAFVPWLTRFFDSVAGNSAVAGLGRLLLRLTVTGNFVWNDQAEALLGAGTPGGFLDGEVLRARPDSPYGLVFPSGDRLPGGNFEMWFWLRIPQHTPSPSIEVFPSSLHFGTHKVGDERDDIAVIVTNKGGASLVITSLDQGSPTDSTHLLFQLSSTFRLPITLGPGQSIKLVASFGAESGASGTLTREFVIGSNGGPARVTLTANVTTT